MKRAWPNIRLAEGGQVAVTEFPEASGEVTGRLLWREPFTGDPGRLTG